MAQDHMVASFIPFSCTHYVFICSVADPVLGTSGRQDLPCDGCSQSTWQFQVAAAVPCQEHQHGELMARLWWGGQVVFQGSSGWELGRVGVPGRALASLVLPACQPQLLPGGFKTVLSSCFKFPGRGLQGGGSCRLSGVWAAIYQGPLWDAALQAGGSHNCFQLGCQPAQGVGGRQGGQQKRGAQGHEGSLPA